MSPSNFDWFIHTMLVYHTLHILKRQQQKADKSSHTDDEDDNDGGDDVL